MRLPTKAASLAQYRLLQVTPAGSLYTLVLDLSSLRASVERSGHSVSTLAEHLEVTRQQTYKLLSGASRLTAPQVAVLVKVLSDYSWIHTQQEKM